MKKRMLCGLLAVLMLLTTAFAAGDAAAPSEAAAETALTFSVTLPDGGSGRPDEATVEALTEVLAHRLAQLGAAGATVEIAADGQTATVALPAHMATADAAAFLAQTNALRLLDANGQPILTGADVAEAVAALTEDGQGAQLTLALTEAAQQAIAGSGLPLTVTLDGETVGQTTAPAAGAPCIVTGIDTLDAAKLLAARIMARELPVALTAPDAPDAPDAPEDAPQPPAAPVFPDVAGHWAENALRTAVDMGLLKGVDGKMLPDHPVKRAEAIVMLDRALGATTAAPTTGLSRVPQHAWYANDLGKAIHLGLIAADDDRYFDAPASRAEAFELLARAFVFDRAQTASDALQPFTDADAMTAAQRQAAAVLVESGIIQGSTATTLAPQAQLTRAQFVTMITRVASHLVQPQEDAPAALAGGSILALPDSRVEDVLVPGDLVFAAPTAEAVLDAVTAQGRIVLKGGEQTALTLSNGTLLTTLAVDPAGTATVYLSRDSKTDTLVIAGTGGAVSYQGAVNAVEITASGRTIDLSGVSADALTITGSGNTIVVDGTVGTVTVAPGAKHNALTLNGAVQHLTVAGVGTRVDGRGRAEAIDIRVVDRTIDLPAGATTEQLDPGLAGVALEMGVPTKVTPGGSLLTQVKFTGVTAPKTCTAQWYQDGQPLAGCGNDHFLLTADALSRHTTTFHFTKDMPSSVTMGFRLTYHNPSTDELEQRYIEKTVPIENYSDAWYYERDAKRVLGLVSSTYRGNYTTSYAVKNDYSATEKEVWVNAKGYASKTPYLAWINRAYQHVNIFKGSKGDWKLVKSFVVGTGAASTPTPVGVTHVTYKSAAGWTTGTYTVRPVVGFYPNSGYAFHSRLCYPGTDREYDFSSGYPVSHGCVRMQKSDIRWIYDNVPIGTTVVIF